MKMKKIKYMAAAALLMLGSSCGNDWLDVEPPTALPTSSVINSLDDMDHLLDGVYTTMQSAYAYSGRFVYYADATGDDMQAVKSTMRTGNYYLMNWTKDDAPDTFWYYSYYMIGMCNMLIEKAADLEVTTDDDKDWLNFDLGQAYALRGMILFDLTRFYGYPYLKDNGASLGVPVVERVVEKDEQLSRNTVAECYEAVIRDLKKGVELMGEWGEDHYEGHINNWAALTLLSRVYLYMGDNLNAYNTAVEAIDGAESYGYYLWGNSEYATAWSVQPTDYSYNYGEKMFEIVNTTDDSPGKESLGYLHNPNGYFDICITTSFYDLLMEDPDDVRLQLLKYSKTYGYFVYKYQPQSSETIQDANIPLVRLSETYLNAAEAAAKLGDNANAVKYLDAIVSRANPDKTVQGTVVTVDRVKTERRKELVAEGHRMYDALRDGGYVDRVDVDDSPLPNRHLSMDAAAVRFNWDYYKCVLPIPKAERDANPNVEQNPGYGN